MNEPDLDARDGTEECAAFQKAASVTSDAVTDLNCAAISRLRNGFCYRIKLTLWYISTDSLTLNNSTIIKRVFLRAVDTNGEDYELATCCRGEGENIMFTERQLVGEDTLNEYAIGVWNDRRIGKTEDLWEYALHPIPYFKLSTIGKMSWMVQVVREDMEGELHIGSPMAGRSRRGSMRVTQHL
ncbi:hypothetical protein HBI09_159960 [Parastagonospora nodorum]|nr:hypothetical protein HBI09_159960 [Parastagonospora nodorum]KAH4999401.1 hypothetical protein HBI77_173200 [Parastagonospora nodorum]